ncbi:MAG: 5'-methylthioadenosine/adenosylhomocysteine nucleosidase [Ruminococcus sp.]|nr:5'-methylthioadenosine/adenosylhomocysteine nucleosidase [Ruminococcus sp.]
MVGIICAMAIEVDGLKALMRDTEDFVYANMTFTKGYIENSEVVAVECGIGKVNAAMCAQTMIDRFEPDVIINSGVAGATHEEVKICDMVVGTEVLEHDMNTSAIGDPIGLISLPEGNRTFFACDEETSDSIYNICKTVEGATAFKGRIASGDLFVSRRSKRHLLNIRFEALACEMEGGAIGHVCFRNKVPFCVFRVISDDFSKHEGLDFKAFSRIACERSIKIIKEYISTL